jgi:hypothetical protein
MKISTISGAKRLLKSKFKLHRTNKNIYQLDLPENSADLKFIRIAFTNAAIFCVAPISNSEKLTAEQIFKVTSETWTGVGKFGDLNTFNYILPIHDLNRIESRVRWTLQLAAVEVEAANKKIEALWSEMPSEQVDKFMSQIKLFLPRAKEFEFIQFHFDNGYVGISASEDEILFLTSLPVGQSIRDLEIPIISRQENQEIYITHSLLGNEQTLEKIVKGIFWSGWDPKLELARIGAKGEKFEKHFPKYVRPHVPQKFSYPKAAAAATTTTYVGYRVYGWSSEGDSGSADTNFDFFGG